MNKKLLIIFLFFLVLPFSFGIDVNENFNNLNLSTSTYQFLGTLCSAGNESFNSVYTWDFCRIQDYFGYKKDVAVTTSGGLDINGSTSSDNNAYFKLHLPETIDLDNNFYISFDYRQDADGTDAHNFYLDLLLYLTNSSGKTEIVTIEMTDTNFQAYASFNTDCNIEDLSGVTLVAGSLQKFYLTKSMLLSKGCIDSFDNSELYDVRFHIYTQGASLPLKEYYLDNFIINSDTNLLPYWNITWTPTLYINDTSPTATLNFDLETYDDEGDTIYYSSQTGYNYNKTEVIDFEKYECGLFTCNYVADYGDLEYIYTFENSCSIDTVGVFDYEITIDYHETDEKTFTYLVLNPMCANPIRIYTNVLNSNVNYLEILTSATTIDEFNIFGMTLTGEVLFNFTSIDLNSTVSTIYNNGSQAENVTVSPYMVQFETQNLNDNIYTVKVWDTYNSYSRTYNTSIDTTNKKMAFLGMEVNQGYVGINKIVKSEVIQNFNWTTTKPTSVTFNNAGLYSHKIYITDSFHLPINEYDTITMDVTVIDTTSYYYNEEGEEFFEEIDNVIGTNWRDYFQNLELNDKLNKFFPWLWFGLLIFFTYTFFVSTHEIKLTLAGLLSSSICLIFAVISRSTIPILSFLVLTGITGIVLIMGTRQ